MNKPQPRTLGERLKFAREAAKLSQIELAKRVKTSPGSIGNYESNTRRSAKKVAEIAAALGVRALWLESGTGPMKDQAGAPPQSSDQDLPSVAQDMSDRRPMLKPRLKTWEEAVETRERAPFALEIRDRALGDAHPVGNIGVFVPEGEPQSGDAVLILAADGLPHLRYYEAGLGGEWRGVSSVIGYPPITGEILAVMATSMRRGLYEAM